MRPNLLRRVYALTVLLAFSAPFPVFAKDVTFVGMGAWSNRANWDVGRAPLNGDNVFLPQSPDSYVVQFDGSYVSPGLASLNIDGAFLDAAAMSLFTQSGGAMVAASENIGRTGKGYSMYTHTGGANTVSALSIAAGPGTVGVYSLGGNAVLSAGTADIGVAGVGALNQTGGAISLTDSLRIGVALGSRGTYAMSSGKLVLPKTRHYIGCAGEGTLTHTGGTVTARGGFILGQEKSGDGTYNLVGIANLIASGDEVVGYSGKGTFDQNGASHVLSGSVTLAAQPGSFGVYRLRRGKLLISGENGTLSVGAAGSASFEQTGGNNSVSGSLIIGDQSTAVGTYTLSEFASSLTVNDEVVGAAGTAVFDQLGGTHVVSNSLTIAANPGSAGAYNLRAGSLSAASLRNNGLFSQTGGSVNVGALDGTGQLRVGGPAELVADHIVQAALTLDAGASVVLRPKGEQPRASVLQTLTIARSGDAYQASLDLADNSLIVRATGADRDQVLADLTSQIASARRAVGYWTGMGITSSVAAADPRHIASLGIALNQRPDGSPLFEFFAGHEVDASSILVMYTCLGDANLDGVVNADDYFLLDGGFISQKGGWFHGDFNYDGTINADDYFLIDSVFIAQSGFLSAAAPSARVPEPGALAVLAAAGLTFVRRRSRS